MDSFARRGIIGQGAFGRLLPTVLLSTKKVVSVRTTLVPLIRCLISCGCNPKEILGIRSVLDGLYAWYPSGSLFTLLSAHISLAPCN